MKVLQKTVLLAASILTAALLALIFIPAFLANAQSTETLPTYYIHRSPSINDCDLIGTWNEDTFTCTLTTDVSGHIRMGYMNNGRVNLDGNGHTLQGDGEGTGVGIPMGSHQNSVRNLRIINFENGIGGGGTYDNVITGNTIDGNEIGLFFVSTQCPSASLCGSSVGNEVFRNNFLDNATQVYDVLYVSPRNNNPPQFPNYNSYSQPAPDGGNYWQGWDGPDDNLDGFVDIPYVITENQQDALPWTEPDGWLCERSSLSVTGSKSYWSSYADYRNRSLSVDFTIENSGTFPATGLQITDCDASGGVTCSSPVPFPAGSIGIDDSGKVTLTYRVPEGTTNFLVRVTALDDDSCGNSRATPLL